MDGFPEFAALHQNILLLRHGALREAVFFVARFQSVVL
jgi:hypothetical protein